MAFDYFAWRNVNVAVVETGLGGRLDSTNIVTPELSIITNVGLEHQQFLGDTLEQIASEKAGIIKHGKPVIVGRADGIVRDVIEAQAKRMYAEVKFAQDRPEVKEAKHVDGMLRLNTKSYGTINCELVGDYQVENTNTVLVALNLLKRMKYRIKNDAVKEGFAQVVETTGLMGRWMKLDENPLLICDSAHNPDAIGLVMRQLEEERRGKLHLILGFMADKDVSSILDLLPGNATLYFTQAQTPRSMSARDLKKAAAKHGLLGNAYDNVEEALAAARQVAEPHDLIYVGGSMYVLAELLTMLGYGEDQ
jgi:dihydrofolate synthase/folylpolyglutamate synthase